MSDAKTEDAPKPKGKKGLIVAIVAGVLTLGAGGGAAWYFLGRGEVDEEAAAAQAEEKRKAARVFVTLEPFVVNLADRESERYAQIGVVLEVQSKDVEQKIATKMPAVRNQILLLISSKQAAQLTNREGKQALAGEIALAAAGPLGWTPPEAQPEPEPEPSPKVKTKNGAKPKPAPRKAAEPVPNPIAEVHFASFLVQ